MCWPEPIALLTVLAGEAGTGIGDHQSAPW